MIIGQLKNKMKGGYYRDAYHLGFFAGITIECDYVAINLNGHKLSQTVEFYYQQR